MGRTLLIDVLYFYNPHNSCLISFFSFHDFVTITSFCFISAFMMSSLIFAFYCALGAIAWIVRNLCDASFGFPTSYRAGPGVLAEGSIHWTGLGSIKIDGWTTSSMCYHTNEDGIAFGCRSLFNFHMMRPILVPWSAIRIEKVENPRKTYSVFDQHVTFIHIVDNHEVPLTTISLGPNQSRWLAKLTQKAEPWANEIQKPGRSLIKRGKFTMGADIRAFLLLDDNTPSDEPPFTNDPSTWDLTHDIGLAGSKDYVFYAAIGGIRNTSGIESLFPWRGLPPSPSTCDNLKDLADDDNVSWLTLTEIRASLAHQGADISSLSKYVRLVLRVMEVAEDSYGVDRVRLVFQIND